MTKRTCTVCGKKSETVEWDGIQLSCEACRQYAHDMMHEFDEPETIDDEWEEKP